MTATYKTKKGIKHQVNFAVLDDVNAKFLELCEGDSRSVVFSQWVRERYLAKFGAQPAAPAAAATSRKVYGVLGQTN